MRIELTFSNNNKQSKEYLLLNMKNKRIVFIYLPVRAFPPAPCGGCNCGGGNSLSIFFNTIFAIHFMSSSRLSGQILGGMLLTYIESKKTIRVYLHLQVVAFLHLQELRATKEMRHLWVSSNMLTGEVTRSLYYETNQDQYLFLSENQFPF